MRGISDFHCTTVFPFIVDGVFLHVIDYYFNSYLNTCTSILTYFMELVSRLTKSQYHVFVLFCIDKWNLHVPIVIFCPCVFGFLVLFQQGSCDINVHHIRSYKTQDKYLRELQNLFELIPYNLYSFLANENTCQLPKLYEKKLWNELSSKKPLYDVVVVSIQQTGL